MLKDLPSGTIMLKFRSVIAVFGFVCLEHKVEVFSAHSHPVIYHVFRMSGRAT